MYKILRDKSDKRCLKPVHTEKYKIFLREYNKT